MALFLLTLLRGSGNYRLLSGLEGLLNGTFAYYLLLVTFGLVAVASLRLSPRPAAARPPRLSSRPLEEPGCSWPARARIIAENSAFDSCGHPLSPTYFNGNLTGCER